MRNWNYTPERPIKLTLAADARLGPTDYTNDQIWLLTLGNSDPPSIALETTFGLRARLCRIFPRFVLNDQRVNDPAHFSQPVTILRYFPNYICLSFKPFSPINVKLEYWVPGSQVIAARTKITNTSDQPCNAEVEWAELLQPFAEGSRMASHEIGMNTLLAGKTSDISPVFFMTGGAQSGQSPYPSLTLPVSLAPHAVQEICWVHASLSETESSFERAKQVIHLNWNAEFARLSRTNSRMLDIYTGNPDWDYAFLISQNLAYQLFLGSTPACKAPSIVQTRKPDQGYSLLKDGSDYNHLWNGQTAIDVHHLAYLILPASPELLRGLLDNFFDHQSAQGEVDWKPGLGGQRSHLLATPLLADMSFRLFEYTGDVAYLKAIFPKLVAFFTSWFVSERDRDGDQYPEWDQVVQTGFEDLPLFSQNHPWSSGVDISTVECPDLLSYLYNESTALFRIARILGDNEAEHWAQTMSEQLRTMADQTWSDHHASYQYRDRDSHHPTSPEILGSIQGNGVIEIHKEFYPPVRPTIWIDTKQEVTHPALIFIHGTGASGRHRIERIATNRIRWQVNSGTATSDYTYSSIERFEINGIRSEDTVTIRIADLACLDISLLLPLWAGIPSDERAKILVNLSIMNKKKFLSPYGLRSSSELSEAEKYPDFPGLHFPWIELVLEGLVSYGERSKAAEIFTRLMKAVAQAFQQDSALYPFYHDEIGKPSGTQNSLSSLIPVGVFLNILGIKIVTPTKVELSGHNPFPWPVTVKYQGLIVVKQENKTLVVFPNGQSITVDNNEPHLITCE